MKTPPSATPPDPESARVELIAMLDEFNLPIEEFNRKSTLCFEKQLAAHSLRDLKKLYLLLLDPGFSLQKAAENCPSWPAGRRFAGQFPCRASLQNIRKRLRAASTSARKLALERRKLQAREDSLRLRETQLGLEQKKLDLKVKSAPAARPEPPINHETPGEMVKRIYGVNPFKN